MAITAVGSGAQLELLHVVEEPRMSRRVRESAEGREAVERLEHEFVLEPAAGVPARSARVERQQSADAC